jgi:hypothetical protein
VAPLRQVTGPHLELAELAEPLRSGTRLAIIFEFQNSGPVTLNVPVAVYEGRPPTVPADPTRWRPPARPRRPPGGTGCEPPLTSPAVRHGARPPPARPRRARPVAAGRRRMRPAGGTFRPPRGPTATPARRRAGSATAMPPEGHSIRDGRGSLPRHGRPSR